MHPSSVTNMKRAMEIVKDYLFTGMTVLDVGGRNIGTPDRSYKHLYDYLFPKYYVADINEGPNVTHIMKHPYELPFEDDSVDLIVSGQTLEHVRNPFRSVAEMKRVLKPGGYMILIAPSQGKYHDNPDCWRFMDDAFKSIAAEDEVDLEVIADWVDLSAPDERSQRWKDHTFVGQKR